MHTVWSQSGGCRDLVISSSSLIAHSMYPAVSVPSGGVQSQTQSWQNVQCSVPLSLKGTQASSSDHCHCHDRISFGKVCRPGLNVACKV